VRRACPAHGVSELPTTRTTERERESETWSQKGSLWLYGNTLAQAIEGNKSRQYRRRQFSPSSLFPFSCHAVLLFSHTHTLSGHTSIHITASACLTCDILLLSPALCLLINRNLIACPRDTHRRRAGDQREEIRDRDAAKGRRCMDPAFRRHTSSSSSWLWLCNRSLIAVSSPPPLLIGSFFSPGTSCSHH
jgi:hypothetical protein